METVHVPHGASVFQGVLMVQTPGEINLASPARNSARASHSAPTCGECVLSGPMPTPSGGRERVVVVGGMIKGLCGAF